MAALAVLFGISLFSIALFLILLVLVQRGRGGGLSGALGGMGGQSAFGTKAGDLFTRITIVVATIWILLCIGAILVLNPQHSSAGRGGGESQEYRVPTMEPGGAKPKKEEEGGKVEGGGAESGKAEKGGSAGAAEAVAPPSTGATKSAAPAGDASESKK